ncbi:unnamed protein product [Effrenium voratum]|uniref:Uncharacterized protein n=1 Tax=Effrenium voratum TaxID=2562239 RepID=A0AA36I7X4_9DINO|nr:unnamed protein product [Effrenium voratum]CAJ1444966.1 unnamed protein product [Effrenium voratum]
MEAVWPRPRAMRCQVPGLGSRSQRRKLVPLALALFCLRCTAQFWAFLPATLRLNVTARPEYALRPKVATGSTPQSQEAQAPAQVKEVDAEPLTPEEERQRLSAERIATLKAAASEGDLQKIIEALGLPLWLFPVLEVFIAIGELGIIYFWVKLLPPEMFGWLPPEARSFLQLGVTEVP